MGTVRYTNVNGRVVAEMRNGVRKAYAHDPLGSTAALVDNTGTVTDTFEYWPYGEERTRTGTIPTPFRFVGALGYYRDSANRTYVRARHYRQDHGRWISIDPLWPDESAYGYSRQSPLTLTDADGLQVGRRTHPRKISTIIIYGDPPPEEQGGCWESCLGRGAKNCVEKFPPDLNLYLHLGCWMAVLLACKYMCDHTNLCPKPDVPPRPWYPGDIVKSGTNPKLM